MTRTAEPNNDSPNPDNAAGKKLGRPRRRRRILLWIASILLLAFTAAAAAWFTGLPQVWASEAIARHLLAARVDISGAYVARGIGARRIAVYDVGANPATDRPAAVFHDVDVDYSLRPRSGRYFDSVRIGRAEIFVDARDPDNTNYDFLKPFLEPRDAETENNAFLPHRLEIAHLEIEALFPDAEVQTGDVQLTGKFRSAKNLNIEVYDERTQWQWRVQDQEETQHVEEGFLSALLELQNEQIKTTIVAGAPDLFEFDGRVFASLAGDPTPVEVRVNRARLHGGRAVSFIDPFLPMPLAFRDILCNQLTALLVLDSDTLVYPTLNVDGEITDLIIGERGREIFRGDLDIAGALEGGKEANGTFTVAVNGPSKIIADFQGTEKKATLGIEFADWSQDAVIQAAPASVQSRLEELAFASLTGNASIAWDDPAYRVTGRFSSSGASSTTSEPIYFALDLEGSTQKGQRIEGNLDARMGSGAIQAAAYQEPGGGYTARAQLESVDVRPWAGLVPGLELPGEFSGTLHGNVDITAKTADDPAEIRPNLNLDTFKFGAFQYNRIAVAGTLRYAVDGERINIDTLSAIADDGTTDVSLSEWTIQLPDRVGGGQVAANLDLTRMGEFFDIPELSGTAAVTGAGRIEKKTLGAELHVESGDAGYADTLVPYGSKLIGDFAVTYDTPSATGAIERLRAEIDTMSLRSDRITFAVDPPSFEGRLELESDLKIAEQMGTLAAAAGSLNGNANIRYEDEALAADWSFDLAADELVLPEDVATASGVRFTADGAYDGEVNLSGTGTLTAERLSAAGANIRNISAPATFAGDYLNLAGTTGEVFKGQVSADISVGVLAESQPIEVHAEITRADLALLTEEVQPPEVEMTGIADGALSAVYDATGLREFTLDAMSDTGFSLNRDLVAEILQSEPFQEMIGARRVERAMEKFLGSRPQRPFDHAKMFVYLEGDVIKGEANLESEKTSDYNGLNINLNLQIDQAALAESLKLLEQAGGAGMTLE